MGEYVPAPVNGEDSKAAGVADEDRMGPFPFMGVFGAAVVAVVEEAVVVVDGIDDGGDESDGEDVCGAEEVFLEGVDEEVSCAFAFVEGVTLGGVSVFSPLLLLFSHCGG